MAALTTSAPPGGTDQEWRSAGQRAAGSLAAVDITVHQTLRE
jgi:hypothetical protein